jgi:hypothetical protein
MMRPEPSTHIVVANKDLAQLFSANCRADVQALPIGKVGLDGWFRFPISTRAF